MPLANDKPSLASSAQANAFCTKKIRLTLSSPESKGMNCVFRFFHRCIERIFHESPQDFDWIDKKKENSCHCKRENGEHCKRQNADHCKRQNVDHCKRQNVDHCKRQNVDHCKRENPIHCKRHNRSAQSAPQSASVNFIASCDDSIFSSTNWCESLSFCKPKRCQSSSTSVTDSQQQQQQQQQPSDNNNDWCDACKGSGSFVCCEACPRSFHFSCLEPPMDPDLLPEAAWFCSFCQPRPAKKSLSFFPFPLEMNSKEFQLPEQITNIYSSIVFEDEKNNSSVVEIGSSSRRNSNFSSLEKSEKSDSSSLSPTFEDNLALCHKCGLSQLRSPIAQCTECLSVWHFDCLYPPLCSTPSLSHWKCPLHVEYWIETFGNNNNNNNDSSSFNHSFGRKVRLKNNKRKQFKPQKLVSALLEDEQETVNEKEIRIALAAKSKIPHLGSGINKNLLLSSANPNYLTFGCCTTTTED